MLKHKAETMIVGAICLWAGDCWLAAGLSAICDHRSLLEQVVPMDQSMLENYAGIFHFFFWQYGKWVEVCVMVNRCRCCQSCQA